MKPITIIGIVLIVLGIVVLVSQGFQYTKREKVLDIGPIEATAETRETVPIHPLAAGAVLAAGIVMVVTGAKR